MTCPHASLILFFTPLHGGRGFKDFLIYLRFGLTLLGYGGHSRLWTQSAKFTADSVGRVEIAGDSRLNTEQKR